MFIKLELVNSSYNIMYRYIEKILIKQSYLSQDYFATLQKSCEANREYQYGWVNWTVAAETPDVVYYQSFKAYGLGWKIIVLDEGEEPSHANPSVVDSLYTQYLISFIITVLIRALIISIL